MLPIEKRTRRGRSDTLQAQSPCRIDFERKKSGIEQNMQERRHHGAVRRIGRSTSGRSASASVRTGMPSSSQSRSRSVENLVDVSKVSEDAVEHPGAKRPYSR
jgi:hypothetical protein